MSILKKAPKPCRPSTDLQAAADLCRPLQPGPRQTGAWRWRWCPVTSCRGSPVPAAHGGAIAAVGGLGGSGRGAPLVPSLRARAAHEPNFSPCTSHPAAPPSADPGAAVRATRADGFPL